MAEKTIIDELSERAGLAAPPAADDFDLNPVEADLLPESLYDPALKAQYDAEPKRRIYIPTPENWRAPFPYAERIQINGLVYRILADQDVMVPYSVWTVWQNKKAMEKEVNRQVSALEALRRNDQLSQIPEYIR